MSNGFIKLIPSEETRELQKSPKAFTLLSVIACRARRSDMFNVHNLRAGEALIGDFKNYGMTEQEYRTGKKQLKKWGFATFEATRKGTIARLCNNSVFDINIDEDKHPQADEVTDKVTDGVTDKQRPTRKIRMIRKKRKRVYARIQSFKSLRFKR